MTFKNDPLHFVRRDGSTNNPYIKIVEDIEVYENKIFLMEIPDGYNRPRIKENKIQYFEVFKKEDLKSKEPKTEDNFKYYVDYDRGIIYFNSDANGKTLNVEYYGKGAILTPASRIYTDGKTDAVRTLQDVVDGVENIDSINSNIDTLKGNVTTINTNINNVNKDVTSLSGEVQKVNTKVDNNLGEINSKINTLTEDTVSISDTITSLSDNVDLIEQKIPKKHLASDFQIEGEETHIYRIENQDNVPYTVVEIASPKDNVDTEATLTLMREKDSESEGVEFLDIFNNGYNDSREMGVRVQSRGTGELRDFVFQFNDGTGVTQTAKVSKDKFVVYKDLISTHDIKIEKEGIKSISFYDALGNVESHIGRVGDRLTLYNDISGLAFDFFDDGTSIFYSPSGDMLFYLETGDVYVNDKPLTYLRSGESTDRPTGLKVGESYFDTTLNKPIWWNGYNFVDANGVDVE